MPGTGRSCCRPDLRQVVNRGRDRVCWNLPKCSPAVNDLRYPRNPRLIAQLDVPIREIDKMPPAFMLGCREGYMQERPPFRPLRFTNQCHVRFSRQPISFPRVAGDTGTNNVFPRGGSPPIPGNHMIEVQIVAIKQMTAILAGVLIALEH